MKKHIITSIILLLLTACSQSPSPNQIRTSGPLTKKDLGLILSGIEKTQIDRWVAEKPGAQIRYINSNHKLYEIYNVSKEDLQSSFPQANVSKNTLVLPQKSRLKLDTLADIQNLNFQATNNLQDDSNPFTACVDSSDAPVAQIDVLYSSDDLSDLTVNVNDVIGLTAVNTQAVSKDDLRLGWMVYRPNGTLISEGGTLGQELELSFDMMGEHAVLLFVQDSNDACSMSQFVIGVTGNKPFTGPQREAPLLPVQLDAFYHLAMIDADIAWNGAQGNNIIVAVIDSGVHYNHPNLIRNILVNTEEIPNNNIDDDGNGYIDDVVGYDFMFSDPFPYDDNGHGSHVAGTIASGNFGIAPQTKILPIKALSSAGGDLGSIIGGIYYAADRNVDIINMSFGGYDEGHPLAEEALKYAEKQGIVLVAASGNGHPETGVGLNIDIVTHTPASFDLGSMISVGSTGDGQTLATYSNFGAKSVDIVAPGGQLPDFGILSAYMENPQNILVVPMQGTSMATPVVSGIASLVLSANPGLNNQEVKDVIMLSGVKQRNFKGVTVSGRLANAANAVALALEADVDPVTPVQLPLFSFLFSDKSSK